MNGGASMTRAARTPSISFVEDGHTMLRSLMSDDLSPEHSHFRARAALTDAFFWDASDDTSPFGNETGRDVLDALRDFRDEHPRDSTVRLLDELLARWEVENDHWDAVEAEEVQGIGEDDEYSLLTRDEAVIALAFAHIIVEGQIDPEVRRRAIFALKRQSLPALLHAWGARRALRAQRLERMATVLVAPWG
jgi:uncharacterized protein YfeS